MNNQLIHTQILLDSPPFLFNSHSSEMFLASLREMATHHYEKNPFFRFYWKKKNIHPQDLQSEEDLKKMPFLLVNLFKNHEMYTGAKEKIILTLGSSGTTGQRSLIHLDEPSLLNVKKLAYNIHNALGMTSQQKYNYLCFTYDPRVANDLGTAFTDELLTSFTDKNEVYYTFQHNGNDFIFDQMACVEKLKEFEKSQYPTRILGFPAFLYQLIEEHKLSLNLGENSWVQTGGGWKGQAEKEIPKKQFRKVVSHALGIPQENIRDLFGMVEHGVPYVDAYDGRLRIPNYARVLIRDPISLEVLPNGQQGLIQLICTYNSSYPAMSLLTTDWGKKISCEQYGDVLELCGRAGISKHKGCALKALELL